MPNVIRGRDLSSIDISPDGDTVRVNVHAADGGESSLELPAASVDQLLLMLPRVLEQTSRHRHGNDATQLVHGVERFRIEVGQADADGTPRYVLTLRTHDGHEVAFALTGNQLGLLVQTVVDQVLCDGAALEPVTLNA